MEEEEKKGREEEREREGFHSNDESRTHDGKGAASR